MCTLRILGGMEDIIRWRIWQSCLNVGENQKMKTNSIYWLEYNLHACLRGNFKEVPGVMLRATKFHLWDALENLPGSSNLSSQSSRAILVETFGKHYTKEMLHRVRNLKLSFPYQILSIWEIEKIFFCEISLQQLCGLQGILRHTVPPITKVIILFLFNLQKCDYCLLHKRG